VAAVALARVTRDDPAFLGITDVEVIAAERQMIQGDAAREQARARIAALLNSSEPTLAEA